MATIQLTLSEAKIKEHQAGDVFELNDDKDPIRLRFNASRESATLYIVYYKGGKTVWHKAGTWPLLSIALLRKQLPRILLDLRCGKEPKNVAINHFETINQVLSWYKERSLGDSNLSAPRKANIKTTIERHLIPALNGLLINELTSRTLEEKLLWPKQSEHKLSTVKSFFNVLSAAFNQAYRSKVINQNPIKLIKFTDSIKADIKPKEGKLKLSDIPALISTLEDGEHSMAKALVFMMLRNATRIGETRMAKWSDIDLATMTWHIPVMNNKSRRIFSTPITRENIEHLQLHRNFLRSNGYTGPYIFPSSFKPKKGISSINAVTANNLIKEISQGNWTSHDLRKLASDYWMKTKEDYLVRKFLLNHHVERIDATYMNGDTEDQKREVIERWQAHLSAQKGKIIPRWQ